MKRATRILWTCCFAFVLQACNEAPLELTTEETTDTRWLSDFVPGECPLLAYTETKITVVDAEGNVVSETWEICTQCYAEDGTPIGEPECTDLTEEPPIWSCEETLSDDPRVVCYVCTDETGAVLVEECFPLPGGSDPCVPVDSLPGDPTGIDCWSCTDPVTGEDWGSWCNAHVCLADGTCADPAQVCDTATNTCTWEDPCKPVASLPSDPTGFDCFQCTDPVTGADWGGWCNGHTCETDDECAPFAAACNDAGICEWVDPCVPVESLPSDPTGFDCFQCTDPATGADWGGWCNGHTCEVVEDCGCWGNACTDGVCTWVW